MLIHGVAFTAELNWGKVFAPLSRYFRVIAIDLRGHGDGIRVGSRFRLEDCADDIAALAEVLGISSFIAVGYSMGGMIAQLMYKRHARLLSGLVLCATTRNVLGSPMEKLAALALPSAAAAIQWNPLLQPMSAEFFGMMLLGPVDDPATARWARAQMRRTSLATAISAVQAAINTVASIEANVGATQNQLTAIVANLTVGQQNLQAAYSGLVDVNFAQATSSFSTDQILMQSGVSMLSQAQQEPSMVLKLLQ